MSLRVRLIVAFFLLSVVPLAAVTIFTYTSNVRAVKDAAAREADLLAGELTQRMQLVTTQLTERVEHLMDLQSAESTLAADAPSQPAAPRVTTATVKATTPITAMSDFEVDQKVALALGEAAMLLNNVDLTGLRRGGDQFRDGQPPAGGRGGGRRGPGSGSTGSVGSTGSRGSQSPRTVTPPAQPASPVPPVTLPPNPAAVAPPATTVTTVGAPAPPPTPPGPPPSRVWAGRPQPRPDSFGTSQPHRQGPPPSGANGRGANAAGDAKPRSEDKTSGDAKADAKTMTGGLRIDLAPLRQELFKQIVPQGQYENLTLEQRRAVGREVTQRLLGIQQGIQLGAAELQKFATDAQRAAAEQTKAAEASAKVAEDKKAVAGAGKAVAAEKAAVTAPMNKKSALSGNRLDVRRERDGNVVQEVNAEINLQNVLQTVFSTTRTDRGEVPFAIGADGHLYTPTDADKKRIEPLGAALKVQGTPTATANAGEWIVVTTNDPTGSGLRFGIARPVGDSMDALKRTAARNASFGLLFIGLAVAGIVPLSGRLTRNLTSLTEGVGRIAQGDFRARVPVRSHDEIGRLAGAFNQMAADVERHQAAAVEQERIRRELELGRQIQHEMLPHAPMLLGLTEIQGVSVPAREVGGDFFNYFEIGDGQIALLVGDVSGKGVGAALVMANIQASLRTRLSLGRDLSAIADAIDRDIEANSPGPVYATLFVGILDPASRTLRYVNAGHHPQYVLRRDGLERMASTGLPVGLLSGKGYTERQVQLSSGDVIFFYTDGCVEAENGMGDMFGAERLEKVLTSAPVSHSADLLLRVETGVKAFRGTVEPFDDETMMAVRVG